MQLLKPHNDYGNIMSVYKTILRTKNFKIMVQEYYEPHFLEFTKWEKEYSTGMYILRSWKKLPLNKYARVVQKLDKLDSQSIKLKAYVDKMARKEV